jgi:hypothetical protein
VSGGDDAVRLDGGDGADSLTGGADTDRFWFAGQATGNDVITDFQNGRDRIRITGNVAVYEMDDLNFSTNGSGWAVIIFPDGSTVTLEGTTESQLDESDFVWV